MKPTKCTMSLVVALVTLTAFSLMGRSEGLDSFPRLCDVRDFEDFLAQTGKVYTQELEYSLREALFKATKTIVDSGNKLADEGLSPYRMTLNILADMTPKEVSKWLGSKISVTGENLVAKHINPVTSSGVRKDLPDSFDWRELGGVTPARYQGVCGSCWSFATIAALEGHLFRRTGVLVPLSEQNLVDCSRQYGLSGCDGGFQDYAFKYIINHGVSLLKNYPYSGMDDQCMSNTTGNAVQIRDYARIKPGDEEKMKEVVATLGPLACSLNGSPITFLQYKGGIYTDESCNAEEVNHSVAVVGYGSENGQDYWIIKNSYSETWGEMGFMKLPRNRNSFCGIAHECSYPIL